MKRQFQTISIFFSTILLVTTILFSGCSERKEKVVMEKTVTFENNDWDFTKKNIHFEADIPDIKEPCMILIEINHEATIEPVSLPITVTITSPEGAESSKRAVVNFMEKTNDTLTTAIAYKEKYFNMGGIYKFRLYRKYPKFNLYGVKSVTVKVIKLPKEKK